MDTWASLKKHFVKDYQPLPTEDIHVSELSSRTSIGTSTSKTSINTVTKTETVTETVTPEELEKKKVRQLRSLAKYLHSSSSYEINDYVFPAWDIYISESEIINKNTLCYVIHLDKNKRGLWGKSVTVTVAYVKNGAISLIHTDDREFVKVKNDEIAKYLTPVLEDFVNDKPIDNLVAIPGTLLRIRKGYNKPTDESLMCLVSWLSTPDEKMNDLEIFYIKDNVFYPKLICSKVVCIY